MCSLHTKEEKASRKEQRMKVNSKVEAYTGQTCS